MNNQEYEQKREQEWRAFCNRHGIIDRGHVILFSAFFDAFDRAYALGREKDTITQEEIEKAWQDYAQEIGLPESLNYATRPMIEIAIKQAFKSGANFTLGKQEKDAEKSVIQGWVARDEDENLFMYKTKPERDETIHMWMGECANIDLRNHLFPDLTWDDDPQECEIIIKRKNESR